MKAILISIQPQWCELIASEKKTIEVRKTRPKLVTPFKCYIYCTKGKVFLYKNPNNGELFLDNNGGYRGGDYEDRYLTGKVVGEFVCNRVEKYEHFIPYDIDDELQYSISQDSLISTCLEPYELTEYGNGKPLYGWHISKLKIYDKPKGLGEFLTPSGTGGVWGNHYLTHPPQSWCYVEEIER